MKTNKTNKSPFKEDKIMENRIELAKMLIKFYNMQAGSKIWSTNEDNQRVVLNALDRCDNNANVVKAGIKEYINEHPEITEYKDADAREAMYDCFNSILADVKVEKQIPLAVETKPAVTEQSVGSALGLLEQAVVQLISNTQAEKIESEIMNSVEDKVRSFIKDEYGTIERKIVTVVDGKPVPMKGIQHEKFETVLKFVANDEPVFLTGAAGTGKNVLCKQVAEALGLKFYFTNAVTQEYKLTGFTDAMGNYQETQFYKAFTQGGVFMLDEMDASIPEVLVILNAAIANRYFDFPAPIGYKEAHPDFRIIAAGNTIGQGADFEYVGRNQLDAASLDRFAIVKVDYSEAIENSVAGDIELANFCRDYRKAAKKNGLQVIVSYRAIGRLAKMTKILTLEEALETCLVKGIEKDDVNMIVNNLPDSKYRKALEKIAKAM